jgi:dolichol-phosphate mannosyltransferase
VNVSAAPTPALSLVIPCLNEAENLANLMDEIALAITDRAFEVIVIDDGSTDGTDRVVQALMLERPWLRLLRHSVRAGKGRALRTGQHAARGEIIVTLDGDGQNDPAFILPLVALLDNGGPSTGLAAGQRRRRTDSLPKRVASLFANGVRGKLLADGTRDTANGLKAIRRDVLAALPFFDNWHRFLPALTIREGYTVAHLDVVDRPRAHGFSKYGILDRALEGALDLFGVWWLVHRRRIEPGVSELDRAG